jgi:hypothetical protein
MLEFLKNYNISDNVIKKVEKENSSANIYNLNCNLEEASLIIEYFNELGLTCIDNLLIYRIDIFFKSLDEIKKMFSKYETNSLVQALNNDYNIINEI